MSVLIGHASIDENNTAHGGTAGDQTGKEVCTRNWYNGGWSVLLRPVSSTVAEKMATACKQGCANDKIGYDQYQRNTLRTYAKAAGWDLSAITTACETDCSAFMTVCAEAAGVNMDSAYTSGNAPVTQTMRAKFTATGAFTALTDSKYLTSSSYLQRGDILVKESGHTAMVLSNGASAGSTSSSSAAVSTTTSTESASTSVEPAKCFDKSKAGSYTVKANGGLNLRTGAGTGKTLLKTLANGSNVRCYGYYTTTGGVDWLLVVAGGATGYVCGTYLV